MAILQLKFAKKSRNICPNDDDDDDDDEQFVSFMQKHSIEVHSRYLSRPDRYDNLPNISISRRFPGKICIITSKHILSHDW